MELRDTMFKDVRLWKSSGKKKSEFIKDKNYTVAKFEYWINKYNRFYHYLCAVPVRPCLPTGTTGRGKDLDHHKKKGLRS